MELTIRIRRGVLGAYWASCDLLPNCTGYGLTHDEAAKNIHARILRRFGGEMQLSLAGYSLANGVPRLV